MIVGRCFRYYTCRVTDSSTFAFNSTVWKDQSGGSHSKIVYSDAGARTDQSQSTVTVTPATTKSAHRSYSLAAYRMYVTLKAAMLLPRLRENTVGSVCWHS
jgi:hypothetical protein